MDGGAWWATVHGVEKSQTRLSDFSFTFHFHALEKEMATHSSVLAWRIPRTGKPGGLPSIGSHRVGHDWSDLASAAAAHVLNSGNWTGVMFLSALLIPFKTGNQIWTHLELWRKQSHYIQHEERKKKSRIVYSAKMGNRRQKNRRFNFLNFYFVLRYI